MLRKTLLLSILLLFFGHSAYANDVEDAAGKFKKDYPSVSVDGVEKSEIDNIYEVFAGSNILYYHPKSGNILFGEMITRDFRNLTVERRTSLIASVLKSIPLDKAIKLGRGKNVVIEFVDIDCPYCRKMEDYFDKREDVTRYVYLMPLEKIHPESMSKSLSVLCSIDRVKAYRDAMKGLLDNAKYSSCEDKNVPKLLDEYKSIAMKLGIQGTPAFWINGVSVNGVNVQQIDQLLNVSVDPQGKEVNP